MTNISLPIIIQTFMSETKVIIVGCGIAGPVLATFLKLKGYNVVVYERFASDRESGSRLL